jgi:hypothetical protein
VATVVEGLIRRIKPDNDAEKPELRHTGWGLTPFDEVVDFYDLIVPEGSRIAYIPVSAGSFCIVVEHGDKHYYFKLAEPGSLYSRSYIIKTAAAHECRPLA